MAVVQLSANPSPWPCTIRFDLRLHSLGQNGPSYTVGNFLYEILTRIDTAYGIMVIKRMALVRDVLGWCLDWEVVAY